MTRPHTISPIIEMAIYIDVDDINNFNLNLGTNGEWGSINDPFVADQFAELYFNKHQVKIPQFGCSILVNLKAYPYRKNAEPHASNKQFIIEYVRLNLVSPGEFQSQTPYEKWKKVLDLKGTNGVIGRYGDFFLGQAGTNEYLIATNEGLTESSLNMVYSVGFSIVIDGIRKYCTIDPFIKTSTDYGP